MKPSPNRLRFSGRASQKAMCESTMKYCSPSFSYMVPSPRLEGLEVEAEVLGRVLRIGEEQDAVVEYDHAAVVRRHDLLEVVLAELVPAQGLGDLGEVEIDLAFAVDADHRRQVLDGDAGLAVHHL